jgi:stage V sporulation protein AD
VQDTACGRGEYGAAMARRPSTRWTGIFGLGRKRDYYDIFATGDLGSWGMRSLSKKWRRGLRYELNYTDCGIENLIWAGKTLDCGGSGCGCCATVLNGYLLDKMKAGIY